MEKLIYPSLDSTSAQAKRLIKEKDREPFYLLAKEQTQGYGRRSHHWRSPVGGLYVTYYLGKTDIKAHSYSSLACGWALVHYLHDQGIEGELKWPNDLMVNGKKIGGLLLEKAVFRGQHHLLVGLGLNVNNEMLGVKDPHYAMTSLYEESGRNWSLIALAEDLANGISGAIHKAEKDPDALFSQIFPHMLDGKKEMMQAWKQENDPPS